MSRDAITIVLNGEVTLHDFATAVSGFLQLIESLQHDVARDAQIEWVIDSLEAGSATATVRGRPGTPDSGERVKDVVHAYEDIGRALESGSSLERYSAQVYASARRITGIINSRVRSVRFETDEVDAEIHAPSARPGNEGSRTAPEARHGAVKGRVQSLSSRGGLRFTLYDLVDDRSVSCYLAEGNEDVMRNAWGKLVSVEGLVRRDPDTGRPTTIREVRSVEITPEDSGADWREAIGSAPALPGDALLPEDAIRRIRDD